MRPSARDAANPLRDVRGYAERLIRFRAGQLVGRYGFTRDDREDLEQDLRLDLLRRQAKFDSGRASLNTFVARVVDHAVATIIERQVAACRDGRLTRVFSDCVPECDEGEATSFEDRFDAAAYLRLTGRADPDSAESIDLHLDFERALSSMPANLQELCQRLVTSSISEISNETGIPRATLYGRVKEIRAHLDHLGFHNYPWPPDTSGSPPVCK